MSLKFVSKTLIIRLKVKKNEEKIKKEGRRIMLVLKKINPISKLFFFSNEGIILWVREITNFLIFLEILTF